MALRDSYETKTQKRAVDFLKLYDTYFTSANVKVYLQSRITGKMVQVDLATGIGYSYNVSSTPLHVLGTRTPIFISRGNGAGQGSLTTIFKDALYLKSMIKYIFDESMELPSSIEVNEEEEKGITDFINNVPKKDSSEMTEEELMQLPHFKETVIAGVLIPPGYITVYEYERLQMFIRNSTTISNEEKRKGLLELERRKEAQQGGDTFTAISDDAFKVLARKTNASIGIESSQSKYIQPQDVLDIGGIHMLFDIRIVLNNSTPYYNSTDTTIVLRDCKIVSDQLDTSSLQDGIIQQHFNFIFKTVSAA